MNKKLILLTALNILAFTNETLTLSKRVFVSPNLPAVTSKTAVFNWDLDDVFFKKDKPAMKRQARNKAGATLWKLKHKVFTCGWKLYKNRKKLKGKPVDAWAQMIGKYDKSIGNEVIAIANNKDIITGTAQLCANLDHTHNVLTNQGTLGCNGLINKFNTFFDQFNVITSVNYTPGAQLIQKPNVTYYQMHLDKCDPQRESIHIFIDDKAINAQAAPQADAHYIGIQFDGNIEHLKQDLKDLAQELGLQIKYKQ